jgi:hypothetical protein
MKLIKIILPINKKFTLISQIILIILALCFFNFIAQASSALLSTAIRSSEIDTALTQCNLDGLWLVGQGELKLGSCFLTETSSYSSSNDSDMLSYAGAW